MILRSKFSKESLMFYNANLMTSFEEGQLQSSCSSKGNFVSSIPTELISLAQGCEFCRITAFQWGKKHFFFSLTVT